MQEQKENTLYTVTVYTENQVGILNQISIIFTRRNLNIWSLSVSSSAIEGVHKFTIACRTDQKTIEAVVRQIEMRIDVIKAFYYTDVQTDNILERPDSAELVRRNNAQILEINRTYPVLQKTGHCDETRRLYDELAPYGVLQFVRSGRVAITKSTVERVSRFIELQDKRAERTKMVNAD